MIFHEFPPGRRHAADDTEFNESFATAVERSGFELSQGEQATDGLAALRRKASSAASNSWP